MCSLVHAETVAYWRFEDQISGQVPASWNGGSVPNTILDSSGNGNHMQTWNWDTSPSYTDQVSPPAGALSGIAATGALNSASLDFS